MQILPSIEELVAQGNEHIARSIYGDVTVDDYFRAAGVDPDAVRGEELEAEHA